MSEFYSAITKGETARKTIAPNLFVRHDRITPTVAVLLVARTDKEPVTDDDISVVSEDLRGDFIFIPSDAVHRDLIVRGYPTRAYILYKVCLKR